MGWICGSILSIGSVTIDLGRAKLGGELVQGAGEAGVLEDAPFDLADGVDDGGVVTAVERLGDRRQREVGELAGEVHRELAAADERSGAAGREQTGNREAELVGDGLLNLAGAEVGIGWGD